MSIATRRSMDDSQTNICNAADVGKLKVLAYLQRMRFNDFSGRRTGPLYAMAWQWIQLELLCMAFDIKQPVSSPTGNTVSDVKVIIMEAKNLLDVLSTKAEDVMFVNNFIIFGCIQAQTVYLTVYNAAVLHGFHSDKHQCLLDDIVKMNESLQGLLTKSSIVYSQLIDLERDQVCKYRFKPLHMERHELGSNGLSCKQLEELSTSELISDKAKEYITYNQLQSQQSAMQEEELSVNVIQSNDPIRALTYMAFFGIPAPIINAAFTLPITHRVSLAAMSLNVSTSMYQQFAAYLLYTITHRQLSKRRLNKTAAKIVDMELDGMEVRIMHGVILCDLCYLDRTRSANVGESGSLISRLYLSSLLSIAHHSYRCFTLTVQSNALYLYPTFNPHKGIVNFIH